MSQKPYVYLCSRVGKDAHELNNRVSASLRKYFEVYVPHEEDANNPTNGELDPIAVFDADFRAMNKADICVVVGKFGRDCAFEIGWFAGRNVPIYYVSNGDQDYKSSPMLIPFLKQDIVYPEDAGVRANSFYHDWAYEHGLLGNDYEDDAN